jgi:hypothetical protein
LPPRGQQDDAVRWIAVRHGGDHIHIVAMLARQDGGRPRLSNERYRVREACRAAEERYGLRRTALGDRTADKRPTRAENEKARRQRWPETPRVTLKRAVSTAAAAAADEREFFARLADAGVLVRMRLSTRNPGEVTGYAVALPQDTTGRGGPVWYGGGKLAADLTLPRLRHRWHPASTGTGERLTAPERNAIWEHAARTAADAAAQIRHLTASDPAAAADAAGAALRSRVIRQAADSFDRAARSPYGRIPRPTPTGNRLRQTARLLSATAFAGNDPARAQLMLIIRLAGLIEAVADLRQAQRHAAQAAAAHRAAEHLHTARATCTSPASDRPTRTPTATELMRLDFPFPPGPLRPGINPPPRARRPSQPAPRPARNSRPRPCGPTR